MNRYAIPFLAVEGGAPFLALLFRYENDMLITYKALV